MHPGASLKQRGRGGGVGELRSGVDLGRGGAFGVGEWIRPRVVGGRIRHRGVELGALGSFTEAEEQRKSTESRGAEREEAVVLRRRARGQRQW